MARLKKNHVVFVCDECGAKQRLPQHQRHWCENCEPKPSEMRPARLKKMTSDGSGDLARLQA